ncbi:MAG: hypothetical protein JWQ14_1937 [Adhaeribacter sp.]|nr:hypothetical protein [Adhaeribacter sp.]
MKSHFNSLKEFLDFFKDEEIYKQYLGQQH